MTTNGPAQRSAQLPPPTRRLECRALRGPFGYGSQRIDQSRSGKDRARSRAARAHLDRIPATSPGIAGNPARGGERTLRGRGGTRRPHPDAGRRAGVSACARVGRGSARAEHTTRTVGAADMTASIRLNSLVSGNRAERSGIIGMLRMEGFGCFDVDLVRPAMLETGTYQTLRSEMLVRRHSSEIESAQRTMIRWVDHASATDPCARYEATRAAIAPPNTSLQAYDFSSHRHPAPSSCLSMSVSGIRYPFFRIMLRRAIAHSRFCAAANRRFNTADFLSPS